LTKREISGAVSIGCSLNRLEAAWRRLLTDDHGQDLVENALVIALIVLGATAVLKSLGQLFSTAYTYIHSTLAAQ